MINFSILRDRFLLKIHPIVIKNYYLPYCKSRIEFDPSNFNRVKESDFQYDMIEMIKKELGLL